VLGRLLHDEDRDRDGETGDGFGGGKGHTHEEFEQASAPRSSSSAEMCFAAPRVVARCDDDLRCCALFEACFRVRDVVHRDCSVHIALGVVHSGSPSSMR
jgi:hypothetical protein